MAKSKKVIQHDAIVGLIASRLREKRLERGMSQADLAKQADVTTNYISAWKAEVLLPVSTLPHGWPKRSASRSLTLCRVQVADS